jgi:hypothetical protein
VRSPGKVDRQSTNPAVIIDQPATHCQLSFVYNARPSAAPYSDIKVAAKHSARQLPVYFTCTLPASSGMLASMNRRSFKLSCSSIGSWPQVPVCCARSGLTLPVSHGFASAALRVQSVFCGFSIALPQPVISTSCLVVLSNHRIKPQRFSPTFSCLKRRRLAQGNCSMTVCGYRSNCGPPKLTP